MKENAFDCGLFYHRNVRRHAADGSRECEYDLCDYECDGVTMNEIMGRVPVDLVDVNYELLYSKEEVEIVTNYLIKTYLPSIERTTIKEIQDVLKSEFED